MKETSAMRKATGTPRHPVKWPRSAMLSGRGKEKDYCWGIVTNACEKTELKSKFLHIFVAQSIEQFPVKECDQKDIRSWIRAVPS